MFPIVIFSLKYYFSLTHSDKDFTKIFYSLFKMEKANIPDLKKANMSKAKLSR